MGRRVMIGVLAAVSMMATWWADAGAATCLQYRTLGGSSVCSAWSTKGVQVDIDFNQACGTSGENCTATARADTTDSIAFCQVGTNTPIRRECITPLTFGPTPSTLCTPKHDPQDVDPGFPGEPGHARHGCTANIVLSTPPCQSCCTGAGEICVDVTPIEMDTSITAVVNFGFGEDFVAQSTASGPGCSSGSSFSTCTWEEHCSINPKKIALDGVREYQCNLENVFNGGGGD